MIRKLLFVIILTFCATRMWGQTGDLSGTYYIAFPGKVDPPSEGYFPSNPGSNYYLCPTEGWIYYNGINNNGKTLITNEDNGQPFLTSYTCKDGSYDADKAVWTLIKKTINGQDYYNIQHCIDNKYLIYNPSLSSGGSNRLRVHLESTETLGDNALFTITKDDSNSGYYFIAPKGVKDYWLNLTEGNSKSLQGASTKTDGPDGYKNVGGTLGGWTQANNTSRCFLEPVPVAPPTFTVNADGSVSISGPDNTTIYYTLDDSDPKSSETKKTVTPISAGDIADATGDAIKAVAINASSETSLVMSLPLKSYTYKIVNTSGNIAVEYPVKQVVGKPLTDYTSIPEAIRSSYLNGETVKFYSFDDAFSSNILVSEDPISKTPSAYSNIYVTYTTEHLGDDDKLVHLQGARPFNIKDNNQYLYYYHNTETNTDELLKESLVADPIDKPHLWYFLGSDPYAVKVLNAATKNTESELYLNYSSSTLSLSDEAVSFILINSTVDGTHATLTLKTDASNRFMVTINTIVIPINYCLLDQENKLIQDEIDGSTSSKLELPREWRSPLVSQYHFYQTETVNITNGVYTLTNPVEITDLAGVSGTIYVKYDVDPSFSFDTEEGGENTINEANTKYMIHFNDGDSFYQEQSNEMMDTKSQATYPYSNGDAGFNIYRSDLWTQQSTSGMSERPRWLWYVVSPTRDPYHVKIMSHKDEGGRHNYFRTYAVAYTEYTIDNGTITSASKKAVVTGLTTTSATGEEPTEYMLLTGSNGDFILKTFEKVALDLNDDNNYTGEGESNERRTVTSFEQYWKNYETISSKNIYDYAPPLSNPNPMLKYTDFKDDTPKKYRDAYKLNYYEAWVYAKPISGAAKEYIKGYHWFQTINMGEGEFKLEPTAIDPQVILIDNHGWEIMRKPLPTDKDDTATKNAKLAALRQYDSPMVEKYHWYPSASKVFGYHKYNVSDADNAQDIIIYTKNSSNKWVDGGNRYQHNSTSLSDSPYDHIAAQDASVKTDFYVTYTVKSDYANIYTGAATKEATSASPVVLKQGSKYAAINLSNALTEATEPEDMETVPTEMRWYLKPNFDIDKEMGYMYDAEKVDTRDEDGNPLTSHIADEEETNSDYHTDGKSGFDPYNVQIQSVKNDNRFLTTSLSTPKLDKGVWTGTATDVSLMTEKYFQLSAEGYQQTTLKITNATFMVVGDANGNMQLMPRFDNGKRVQLWSDPKLGEQANASAGDDANARSLTFERAAHRVSSTDEMTDMGGYYLLSENFSCNSSIGTAAKPFTGIIDGKLNIINEAEAPLIDYADGATVRNVIMKNVNISTSGNAGAIANVVMGTSGDVASIYNCGILSGSVSGSDNVGGIVGLLGSTSDDKKCYARVINCYSYATIAGGNNVGGIVGYNTYKSKASDIRTMVMNCMFYGDITSGTNVSPVYGGEIIDNLNSGGLNTFNYYAYDELKSKAITSGKYNCALAIKEEYLNRFEFYRLLLNSNKKLAAIYATGSAVDAEKKMAKWVLETADRTNDNPMPYPILMPQGYYPSIINPDFEHAEQLILDANGRPSENDRNKGGKLGTLSVTISGVGSNAPTGASITTSSLPLNRTDKDFDRFNFNYDKVQLPYYNDVGTGNYTDNRVVTGWKITAMSPTPASDPYKSDNYPTSGVKDFPDHNYADRKSVNKDLYSVSNRVFSQGAYFDVPYGVTSITIEPYWGKAAYVANANYDVVYNGSYSRQDVTQLGTQATNKSTTYPGLNGQTVYTKVGDALSSLSGSTVYDNAIVLVGNLHLNGVPSGGDKAFTMMSVDWDNDHEPDYSMIYHHNGRTPISPIRFDFLNIPGTAQAQKPKDTKTFFNFTIFLTKGWFETTNTCLVYSNQVEYENKDEKKNKVTKAYAPLILLGGDFEQFVSTQNSNVEGKTIYIHVGGNVRIQSFGLGTHGDGDKSTPHVPVSVTGGEYEGFYLSGTYNQDAAVRTNDNAECYISGGHFVEAAGASQEKIDGSVTWQIYDADIDAFYGGGVNAARPITGDVKVDIFNSHVGLYCGGPKFGDMQPNKKVTTNAEGCTFTKFFGAGFGGTSYSRKKYYDVQTTDWSTWAGKYTNDRGKYFDGASTNSKNGGGDDAQYGKKGIGVATDVDYEFFAWSSGTTGGRFYVKFASFSLATCNDVESNLKNCTINENFYGGGSYGEVKGKATSVLDGCTVNGSVFGGGYSATLPTVKVRKTPAFTKNPNINQYSGMFEPADLNGYEANEFEWKNISEGTNLELDVNGKIKNGKSGSDMEKHYIYTDVDLTALGKVGYTDLTVKNNTKVAGSVFGGGDESAVNHDTKVDIQNGGGSNTISNVYGGGNVADVHGDAEVTMTGGIVSQDVYGGGKGETTVVGGDVTVNIGAKDNGGALSGSGLVQRNVYGGSALGNVNTTSDKTTNVNIYAGIVNGSVFGGGLGQQYEAAVAASGTPGNQDYVPAKDEIPAIVSLNKGVTTIHVEGGEVKTTVYGGSNLNGVLEKDVTVTITGGTVGTTANPMKNAVFGGGFGEPTLVNGNVTVNIGTSGQTSDGATINGHVYGGGALGCVNASKTGSDPMVFYTDGETAKKTYVNLYKGTINGDVYGGGLGQKTGVNGATSDVEAYVGGDVTVTLDGAKIPGQIFGCNNLNGTPKGHVKVHVIRTVDNPKDPDATRTDRTTYDVAAVYGGGNQADYVPTKATGTTEEKKQAFAEVLIEGCQKTSINQVYGGGNAAAVPATEVTVKGTYIINTLYGGGNGYGASNPGADVGLKALTTGGTPYDASHPTKEAYGTGQAITKLLGGYIHDVYGGSNTKGDVIGGTDVRTKKKGETLTGDFCDELIVGNIYGAGSHADVDGDVNVILDCMPEDYVDAVYGGAEEATVNGNVSLTVSGGKFGRVFGGNNRGGNIKGTIKVYVKEEGCEDLEIGELYGGGNEAPFSIYGCYYDDDEHKWKAYEAQSVDNGNFEVGFSETELYRYHVKVFVESCTSIGSIFGGGRGASATVIGDTYVNINMMYGSVKNVDKTSLGHIGQVFGGGSAANVKGNTTIHIGTATVNEGEHIGVNITKTIGEPNSEDYENTKYLNPDKTAYATIPYISIPETEAGVYGGGKAADVDGDATLNIGTVNQDLGINIRGNIFGGGYGKTTHVKGNVTVNIGKEVPAEGEGSPTYEGYATITGDVYGGSAKGKVNSSLVNNVETPTSGKTTKVNLYGGSIVGNVYGGGYGEGENDADVYGDVTVTVEGIKMKVEEDANGYTKGQVFGGNNVKGSPKKTTTVLIKNTKAYTYEEGETSYPYHLSNVFGGGNQAAFTGTSTSVVMSNGSVYDVFGGGLGETATVSGDASVNVSGGTVTNNIYGGGSEANLTGNATVTVSGGSAKTVYGGGNAANVGGNTTVDITGGTLSGTDLGGVTAAVFGGGYGESTLVGGSVTVNIGTKTEAVAPATPTYSGNANITGDVYGGSAKGKVNTTDGTSISDGSPTTNVGLYGGSIDGSLYGGGLGEDKEGTVNDHAADVYGAVTVTIGGAGSVHNVFGCNNILGAPQNTVTVNIEGGTVSHDVYGGGNQAPYMYANAANPQNLKVNITGGNISNDVFGGGLSADVAGGISVSVSGGTIANDVYGGGALANTNTANWDWTVANSGEVGYEIVTGLVVENYRVKEVIEGADVGALHLYKKEDNSYVEATGTAEPNVTYYEKLSGTPVAGYYKDSNGNEMYDKATDIAVNNQDYYKKKILGKWREGYNNNTTGTTYKTTVSLTGGLIGNAYGGGLGRQAVAAVPAVGTEGEEGYVPGKPAVPAVAANVYGDVTITVNEGVYNPNKGVTFIQRVEYPVINGTQIITPTSGRVFGCNNHNGTPTGNVEVHVYATRQIDENFNIIAGHGSSDRKYTYEIQSVYGGGNQADYLPAEEKKSKVIIEGCEETSIEKVYGGGNSAVVPETDVLIKGAYDIGYAFGGGNGDKPIKKADGIWYENKGAIVIGLAKIECQGGKIGQVFGGGDSKGSCGNTNAVTKQEGDCTLHITRLYGAGNKGDVAAVNIVLAACSDAAIEYVHGGSYNAHVTHDVHLTITSGILKNVYGGNDARGGIGGNIIVDIEETNGCNPIIIQNLVGGGNEAPYPGTHVVNNEEVPYDTRGKITVNVKSATRIDNIYGGCFKSEANADTEVNINMIQGLKAGKTVVIPKEFSYIPNISEVTSVDDKTISCKINDNIGTIGTVFGGGNQGIVKGNTVVNICSSDKVSIMKRVTEEGDNKGKIMIDGGDVIDAENGSNIAGKTILYNDDNDVLGAHITGNVYGGGELADVTGNTTVNICAKETSGTYEAIAEGAKKVTIGGNVFGGGKGKDDSFTCAKAMVGVVDSDNGSTKVVIGNGTVGTIKDGKLKDGTGDVFGGGEVGRVESNTAVTIGIGNGDNDKTSAPVVWGSVYGAGKGVKTHGYSALVRGNSTVTIQGDAQVKKNVYGGGEIGTVGKYWVTGVPYQSPLSPPPVPTGTGNGMPYATRSGGKCTVIVQGKALIGPDGTATATAGHVFGGGMGVEAAYTKEGVNRSKRMVTYDGEIYTIDGVGKKWDYYEADHSFVWEYFEDKEKYLNYLQTLALVSDAEVTITGNAAVKGNVYGGSQSGFLQRETDVNILSDNVTIGTTGSDGKVYYGNVFGGGRGLPKYDSGEGLKDFDEAGQVKGDANLTITGGTIYGSVYGGGELGFVGKFNTTDHKNYTWSSYKTKNNVDVTESGKCTVNISGTTDIKGHVFGAGKGSDDTFECEQAMVRTTSVTISAGTVNGNVYGGSEVGRVDQDAEVTLGVENASGDAAPYIKGSVYGAGQGVETHGYSGLARGNTTVTIQGTTKVGKSVYGGGEVAAVGRYGLDSSRMPSTLVSGGECKVTIQDHAVIGGDVYGASKGVEPDWSYDATDATHLAGSSKRMTRYTDDTDFPKAKENNTWSYTDATDHTYVWEYFDTKDKYLNFLQTLALTTDADLTIKENATVYGSVYGGSESGFVQRDTEVKIQGSSHIGTTSPVLIGHVFGGGKGVRGFDKAGRVRGNTSVAVSGGSITGNVYGGGELGFVGNFTCPDGRNYEWHNIRGKNDGEGTTTYTTGKCTVSITGGTIGDEDITTEDHASGHVFGAGKGEALTFKCEPALVKETIVSVNNATVYGNVYGGGEVGRVDLNTSVKIGDGAGSSGGAAAPEIKGSVFGAGAGVETHGYSALVRGNTTVTVEGNAKVRKNVYGGGEIAAVGKYKVKTAQGEPEDAPDDLPVGMPYSLVSNDFGNCTVTVQGYAEIGPDGAATADAGHLFGASKGVRPHYYLGVDSYDTDEEKPKRMTIINGSDAWDYFGTKADYFKFLETLALATQANVTIKGNAKVKGNVYGGSENGFVQHHVSVTIEDGTIGTAPSAPYGGDVYGGGKGLADFDVAGRVSGNVELTVNDGEMYGSVYGGGERGIVKQNVTVSINGGTIGNNVYGGGALADTNIGNVTEGYGTGSETIPSTSTYKTTVNLEGGTITHDAYGGALGQHEEKDASGVVTKNSISPKVYGDVLVELNKNVAAKAAAAPPVYEKGCAVERIFGCNDMSGTPKGHVKVHVHATQTPGEATIAEANKEPRFEFYSAYTITDYSGLVALAGTFGVTVSSWTNILESNASETDKKAALQEMKDAVYRGELEKKATTYGITITTAQTAILNQTDYAGEAGSTIEEKQASLKRKKNNTLDEIRGAIAAKKYDVLAVYGGGDLASYIPAVEADRTEVIIDGCRLTSIYQAYGGGNAAYVYSSSITVNGTYEIDEVFGGGNGKDVYSLTEGGETVYYENQGANVGYREYTYYVRKNETGYNAATHGSGTSADPYKALEKSDANTKAKRQLNYSCGENTGIATTDIYGGQIHRVYGGSNQKGNIRKMAMSLYEEASVCDMKVDESYGAGKNAEIDGEVNITLDCVKDQPVIWGGAKDAHVNSDINLTITNGTFQQVFGGNNSSGNIYGSITVNVEERGCQPIIIKELYGCGDRAPYSIYGYENTGTGEAPVWHLRTKDEYETAIAGKTPEQIIDAGLYITPMADPRVNIISASWIGDVFGGGYMAQVIGSPHVNVNMERGRILSKYTKTLTTGQHEVTDGANTYHYYVEEIESITGEGGETTNGQAHLRVGTINNIFGGGNAANIDGDTYVEIGTGRYYDNSDQLVPIATGRNKATITNCVYGGGNDGDVSGNTYVTMANGYVGNRIFGGGNRGSVGTITSRDALPTDHSSHSGCVNGKPNTWKDNTGVCTVEISGGRVGPVNVSDELVVTPASMTMPNDYGYVFGASKGELKDPTVDPDVDFSAYVYDTHVTIKDVYEPGEHEGDPATLVSRPVIMGGVYGGSENGRVRHNTDVKIEGGQIGVGEGMTEAFVAGTRATEYYTEAEFVNPLTTPVTSSNALQECSHWPYGKIYKGETTTKYLPYDMRATDSTEDARPTGSDGHTFYGNVFGGGSGYWSYKKSGGGWEWLESAGLVEGNTNLTISGGHILTNVYGGNETTNVNGTCTITMTGGTLGVPRTLEQITAHPVTCYLFGAGKGDQRTHFNKRTNVGNVVINMSGGTIYGSIFGGGEDGHVLGDVNMTISETDAANKPTIIGTWGTSYVDGNIFGGGRGFSGEALTAGVVCGNVNLSISGGTMLGSIYGGGRLGSIGTHLVAPTIIEDNTEKPNPKYGTMIPDGMDEVLETEEDVTAADKTHGHVTINISGGTIGNSHEYILPSTADNAACGITESDITKWASSDWDKWKAYKNIPNTEFVYDSDRQIYRLSHTKGGNVFAGSMGRFYALDGSVLGHWQNLGKVKTTKLTITDGTIKSNVYGGGELGKTEGTTEVNVKGGTIGLEVKDGEDVTRYTYGSVFGAGYGSTIEELTDANNNKTNPKIDAGLVGNSTKVLMEGGWVKASVYGGGEVASVKGSTDVAISGGSIGIDKIGDMQFGGATMGNVYGGGSGHRNIVRAGHIFGNTKVNISQAEGKTTRIYHNIYGGGAYGTVGEFTYGYTDKEPGYVGINKVNDITGWTSGGTAEVTITGGTIGVDGHENGMVFGSSRGDVDAPHKRDDYVAWVNDTHVIIGNEGSGTDYTSPTIYGSIYGSGENGHTFRNAVVDVHSGTIGMTTDPTYGYRGNVYGAGCGTDTYKVTVDEGTVNEKTYEYYNPWAGCVWGNATVNIDGGLIVHNVYGGGAMGSVGRIDNVSDTTTVAKHSSETTSYALSWPYKFTYPKKDGVYTNGKATINITGGRIGIDGVENGYVFGGARGYADNRYTEAHFANVRESEVNINYSTTPADPVGSGLAIIDPVHEETSISTENDTYATPCITGAVFGGGEDGHIQQDAKITITGGLIGNSVYGGGRGKSTYPGKLKYIEPKKDGDGNIVKDDKGNEIHDEYNTELPSWTAGKVYGNTTIIMSGGYVLRNIYGGGNLGSVGKGNYASGTDDYYANGYGEKIESNMWTSTADDDDAWHFLNSGLSSITITGGTIGTSNGVQDNLPTGNVFGGSRGRAAADVGRLSPRYEYAPDFYLGYTNNTEIILGDASKINDDDYTGPRLWGSVYGGGRDGHVRGSTEVTINKATIGKPYDPNDNDANWLQRGNVFGAGSGLGTYNSGTVDNPVYKHGTSSGSVTRSTTVNINGGTIYQNVYGGGSLATVGPPKLPPATDFAPKTWSLCTVNTQNCTIGTATGIDNGYGGNVFGAGRGSGLFTDESSDSYGTCIWTKVFIKDGSYILGNIYGGGDNGMVKKDTDVQIGE